MTTQSSHSLSASVAFVSAFFALVLECALLSIAKFLPEREGFYLFWLGLTIIILLAVIGIVIGSSTYKRLRDWRSLAGFIIGEAALVLLVVGLFVAIR